MRPVPWNPPIELSSSEQQLAKRIRKAKLFLLLREIRHELFDEKFQEELASIFKDSSVGKCPVPLVSESAHPCRARERHDRVGISGNDQLN